MSKAKQTPSKTKMAVSKTKGFIISNPVHQRINDNIQLLRITVTPLETKVDFGYQATSYYINGGWIKINPKTFIRVRGTNKKLILTNATNIPYGPEKLHFNSSIEWRYFSLHFPPLIEETIAYTPMMSEKQASNKFIIDLIENENGTENDFNFYGINLDDENKKSMIY